MNGKVNLMKVFSENRKASYNYNVLERFEAGLVLMGTEVKSIRLGRISLDGSYIIFKGNEPFLIGAKIPAYQPKNAPAGYEPERSRKLLLNKKEINYLLGKVQQKGLTLIPLKIYSKNANLKIEFGLAKGKKKYNKKEEIKKREIEREMRRMIERI